MAAVVSAKNKISLKGSTDIVTEFFEYGINSILYQRGLYAPEDFKMTKKYGLNLLVTADDGVTSYLRQVLSQVRNWLMASAISKLVLVILSKETREVLERWQFDIEIEAQDKENTGRPLGASQKTEKEVHSEIQAILRQITASVSFLPVLSAAATFNVLAYTDKNVEVPAEWVDSDARLIAKNAEHVRLRGFGTGIHKVDALVAYKVED
ncbi:HORMA domain-containing protein [Hyaloraphidium curvatum]|nr:HORMA domain-containing protein [Hyaloraphidium curvatum]